MRIARVHHEELSMEVAIRRGNLVDVRELILGGADVNACYKGTPFLCLAIKKGHNKVALELIDSGANIHAKDVVRGRTALHWACDDRNRVEVVQRLIERGSSVNDEDEQGITPMHLAARWGGRNGLANCLLRAGANCQVLSAKQKNLLVRFASRRSDVFVVETLIANGCDVNTTNITGNTPLMRAVKEGHEDVVKALILKGAKLDLQDFDGYTALHHAALNDHIQCGVLLVEGGANVGIKDKHSRTALHVARSEGFKEAIKQAKSFTTSKIVCLIGNTGVGKSTLVASLQAESNSFFGKAVNQFWRVSDHRKRTAGIETVRHSSQRYGKALFYDFAGQHDYYGPHQTFLEPFLSKPGVSMTLLLVVKATGDEEAILEQLYLWLFPIAQMAASTASSPRIIVIGSFLDQVSCKDGARIKLFKCIEETRNRLENILPLEIMGACLLNCRQPQSAGIDQLCHFLQEVPTPKLKAIDTQYSLAWVLSQIRLAFKDQSAVQLHTLVMWMQEKKDDLPETIPSPEEVCKDVSTAGHTLYLPNKNNCQEGWLVLDLASILHDVYGTLFSHPRSNFGLLNRKELARLFPQINLEMLQQLLVTLEFCTPVDLSVLSDVVTKLTASKEDSGWFFFPAFVSAEPPKIVCQGHTQQNVCSLWWRLRTIGEHFFTARVLQTILLRLAAHFVVRHDRGGGVQHHCCSFWRNGITWQSKEGVDVIIHITNRAINVAGMSEESPKMLHQYLTDVIVDIVSTVDQFSPHLIAIADIIVPRRQTKLATFCEDIMDPSHMVFPVADIHDSIKNGKKYTVPLPGGDHARSRVADLFGGHVPTLQDIEKIHWTKGSTAAAENGIHTECQIAPTRYNSSHSSEGLTLGASSLPLVSTAESPQPPPPPTLLDVLSKPTIVDINNLVVTPVAARWWTVANYLEVDSCIIEIILKNHPNNCEQACRDMLNRWLQEGDYTGEKGRTWDTLLTAVGRTGYGDLEQDLRKKYFKAA